MNKNKMSNANFRAILIPIVTVMLALLITINIAASMYSGTLDVYLGRGERKIVDSGDNISPEMLKYYEAKFPQEYNGSLTASDPATEMEERSRNEAAKTALKVAEEGITLLKNDGTLPLKKDTSVTPFGYRYISPIYGGSGSAATNTEAEYIVTAEEGLDMYFSVNNESVNKMKTATPNIHVGTNFLDYTFSSSGTTNMAIYEYDASIYNGVEESSRNSVGIVYIGRLGLEGDDLWSGAYDDGTKYSLALTNSERQTIEFAKKNTDKVVVVLSFSNNVEISELANDPEINSIVWIGNPGAKGFEALSKVLVGEVNPSGRTVNMWIADHKKDPSWANVVSGTYTNNAYDANTGTGMVSRSFFEYEEGIYVGYRYYETADIESKLGNYKDFNYKNEVVYPFGYGLHYENDKISQTLTRVRKIGDSIVVDGKIVNASTHDVNETVQIYYAAPYYRNGSKIEKSAKVLAAFDKYQVKAGETYSFTITFNQEEMASYDDREYYTNNGSYVLEEGTYQIYLGKDSHESWGSKTVEIDDTIVFTDEEAKNDGKSVGKRSTDGIVVKNQFPEITKYIKDGNMTIMSRSDFASTYPTAPIAKVAPDYIVIANGAYDGANDTISGWNNKEAVLYKDESPKSAQKNNMTLSSLRGLGYDDATWDLLLDQIDYTKVNEISDLITYGLYMTQELKDIGLVKTKDNDGTTGLTATWGGTVGHVVAVAWPSAPLMAATYNEDIIFEAGLAIGQEALTNNINGWYAPGINLHRSAFGGRNFEYFSEDPYLSGKISAAIISGARENGLFAYIKHFALNEMDHKRSSVLVYASEQSIRELYLRGFEVAVKDAEYDLKVYDGVTGQQKIVRMKATGAVMTSMSFVGPKFAGSSYVLLTTVLRDEWGFRGFVITDFTSGVNKSKDEGYRIGNDMWLGSKTTLLNDLDKPTVQWAVRKAIHNIAFTIVNSSAYNGIAPGSLVYYETAPWKKALNLSTILVGIAIVAGGAWVVIRSLDEKKHPEIYNK